MTVVAPVVTSVVATLVVLFRFAVAVVKGSNIVGHVPMKYSRVLNSETIDQRISMSV